MALHASSVVADDEDGPAPAFAFPSGHWPNRHVAAGGETMTVSLAESEHVNRPSTGIEVGLKPSDCGCGCGGAGAECTCETHSARYVYPIGKIGFDFVNRTHREVQSQIFEANRINLDDRPAVANYLADPANQGVVRATELVWTLEVDEDPLYAIAPVGPLTTQTYERIIEFFRDQEAGNAEYATIPGTIIGKKFLYLAGKEVDVIAPSLDSMANWSIDYLLTVLGDTGAEEEREEAGARRGRRRGQAEANAQPPGPSRDDLRNFFVLLFDKIKNEGRAPADRARNFAVTAVSVLAAFLKDAFIRELQFEEAVVRPSRVRPAGTDRWEVAISFFNPTDQLGTAVREYPMVVDVNYVQPHLVSSGPARSVSSRVRLP
jgi:hypothetical protein